MACGTYTVAKVPPGNVANVTALFQANVPPPNSVTSAPDGTGTYTVTAVFPPCPANTTHSAT
jgi:hypothetical protein